MANTITPAEREEFVQGARAIIRQLGVEAATAMMGAATARVMGKPNVPVSAWEMDDAGDPTGHPNEELEALCRDIEQQLFDDHDASDETRLDFARCVQQAARLALQDLGFSVVLTVPN